jgi:hypothetical protein
MLVLGEQPAEAASFIATARDDAVRNRGTDAQAEALAEIGNPASPCRSPTQSPIRCCERAPSRRSPTR